MGWDMANALDWGICAREPLEGRLLLQRTIRKRLAKISHLASPSLFSLSIFSANPGRWSTGRFSWDQAARRGWCFAERSAVPRVARLSAGRGSIGLMPRLQQKTPEKLAETQDLWRNDDVQ